jgi:hypothetical protein
MEGKSQTGCFAVLVWKHADVGFVCPSLLPFREETTVSETVWFGGSNLNRLE